MAKRCLSPRMKIVPPAKASEAHTGSPTVFVRSTSCLGPALMKNVSPSSLVCRMLSPKATSDERNVAFYERLGFRVLADAPLGTGGPRGWGMRREPARTGQANA